MSQVGTSKPGELRELLRRDGIGYGSELNAVHILREYEQQGVAGIHIEDRWFPKKCGHLENKAIIPLGDYLAKIRAAVSAKRDPDFLIIARTDERAELGFEEAVWRANASLDVGADMAFVEAPESLEEVQAIPTGARSVPAQHGVAREDAGCRHR